MIPTYYGNPRHFSVMPNTKSIGLHFASRNYNLWPIRKNTRMRRKINGTYDVSKQSQKLWFLMKNVVEFSSVCLFAFCWERFVLQDEKTSTGGGRLFIQWKIKFLSQLIPLLC